MSRPSRNLRAFAADRQAVAAIEFALLLPFIIALLFGGIAITDAVMARRKVGQTAGILSDLIAQEKCVDPAFVGTAFSLVEAVVAPLSPANLSSRVSSIVVDAAGKATVAWSHHSNGTPRPTGSEYKLEGTMELLKGASTSFVLAETAYEFTPVIIIPGFTNIGPMVMSETTFARPRAAPVSSGVSYKANCNA